VCIPLVSSTGHGDAALHRVHYQDGKFALANLLVALLPKDPSVCEAKYLYHLLMMRKNELLVPLMQGTANVSLKEQDIAGVEISLPPLVEQRRIVARIKDIATQVSDVKVLRKQEEVEIKHMLLGAFWKIAKDAPRRLMHEVAPLTRRPVNVEPQELYPELGIRSFGKGTFHKPALTGLEMGSKRIFAIEPGDLLFSNVFAWEGAIAVATSKDIGRYGSHRFITCIPVATVTSASFLCFYFLTEEGLELIRSASPGAAGRNRTLGISALANIAVPVPTLDAQHWFGEILAKVKKLECIQNQTATELDALLPSVLSKAFAGEF
jgi:type I restriction enzyme S subunit